MAAYVLMLQQPIDLNGSDPEKTQNFEIGTKWNSNER